MPQTNRSPASYLRMQMDGRNQWRPCMPCARLRQAKMTDVEICLFVALSHRVIEMMSPSTNYGATLAHVIHSWSMAPGFTTTSAISLLSTDSSHTRGVT